MPQRGLLAALGLLGLAARAAGNQGVTKGEPVVELLQKELAEARSEDDTNEGIIEKLLQKQAQLKNATDNLRREVASQKAPRATAAKGGNASLSLIGVAALENRIKSLHAELRDTAVQTAETARQLAEVRAQNRRLQGQVLTKNVESRDLKKKLKNMRKLALLQNTDEARETSASETGGLLSTTSDLSQLSKQMLAETKAVNAQIREMQKKLRASQKQEREEQGHLDQAKAEVEQIRHSGGIMGWRSRLAVRKAEEALQAGVQQLRQAEEVLRAPNDPDADVAAAREVVGDEAAQQGKDVQSQNEQLDKEDKELGQKYALLQSYYAQQQRQIDAVEGRLHVGSMLRRPQIAMLEKGASVHKEHVAASTAAQATAQTLVSRRPANTPKLHAAQELLDKLLGEK